MADIKSLIDKFNIFRTKDSILNDVAKDNGQITIDIKQPFSDDIDSNNSLKTKLETNIKDKLFNTEINNVGSNIFDEKIKPFDKGYNVSDTPDTDTKTPIDTTPIKPDTHTIEKNTADATNIQQEKTQQPEITTPKPKPTQQYKTITEQQKPKLTTDSLGNYMPIDFDERKGKSYSGVGEQQIDMIFNRLDTPEKFDMFMQSVSEAYDQLKSANLNDKENIIFLPYSYDHENGNMNGIRLTFGGRQKEWAEKQLKILETAINDKQNEEWLSNLELPQPEKTMDKMRSNPWFKLFSFMQPPTEGMDHESKRILESGQKENRLNAIKWGLIENIKECKDILDKYYKDKSQVGIALSQKNIAETINNVIFPQIDLVKQSEIASIISKYKKNPKSLTPIENEIVKYYSDYVNALSVVANKTSTGYETTKAIETSLPFMTDFLRFNLVGSATRGGTRAAMKIGGKGLARQIAKDTPKTIGARAFKLGEDILTAAGHTSVSPLTFTNMLEDYSQTMETNGQYTKNDLRRGVIEAFTENFSERMFGALKGILPKSNNAFVNSLFGNNPVIKSMQKHMNVGGLFEETGEEYAGAFVNTMFGFALGDEKLASSFKEQLNNSVPTILSIGITVGLPQAIGMGIDFREIKKLNTRFNVAENNLKQYFNKENSYLDINRYSDALKSLYINLNNAKNEEDKTEIKGKIAELNKTAANLAMEKGDSNGFNLISEYSIAAQNSFYVTNKAMSELKNMSEEDRTKLSDNAINKLKNDFTNNLNWSLISRAAAKNITDQNGKQHPTCFLYTDNGVTYVLNGQKDNMFYFVDVNGNTISKSADELRNNENLFVLHLNNLLSFSNKELEDINSKFIDIAQYNAGYRYKVNDNGEIRYYTDNEDLINSNTPYEQIDRDKIESNLVGSYDLVRIDNITNAVEDMANAFAEPDAEQTSTEQTSTEQQKPAQEPAQEQPSEEPIQEQPQEQPQEPAQEQPSEEPIQEQPQEQPQETAQEQPSEEPIQEQPQEQTTQEPAQEQPIQEQTTEEQETTEQEPIQPAQQQIEPAQEQTAQQEIEPIQEQQPAQEEDDSTALNGVPDIVDDTPQDARTRGFRRVNGYKIDRQKPLQAVNGKEIAVRFSNDVIANGHVAVIDAEQLQPSHIQGVRNPLHFIDEAQPKERNDEASIVSAQRIAKNIRPEEITSSVTAYTGAPIINARGETIQGNNRSDALRLMWSQNKDQAEKYKQYLIDHAQEFGLNAEDIAAMERPILVNMIDVSDEDAIALGQYVAQDTESGGLERIKPKNAVQKMGADMRTFANLLLSSNDDEISFAGLIDKNGVDVLNWLGQKGYITPTQYKSAFDTKGYITAEAKNDLRGIMYQSIFQGGSTRLEEMFNTMPAKAQKAILATAFRDYDSPKSESMIVEIQNSIRAYYALSQSADFMNAKTYKDVRLAVEGWKKQYQIDDATGESYLPAENFSNFALLLATMYKGEKQTLIQGTFNKLYDLIQGTQEADLFETPDNTPRTLSQAIKEVLNIDYNGQQRNNVLVGDTTTSQRGEQGSTRDAATRERTKDGERTTDSAGSIEAESRVAQNEQANTKSQGKKPNIRRIGRVIGSSLSTDEFISETMSIVIKDVKTFPKEIRDEDIISKEQKSGKRRAGIKVKVGLLGNDLYIQYREGRSFANKDKELWEKEKRWYWATIKIPNATNYSAGQLRYRLDYAGTTTDIARIVSDAVLELFYKKELRLHKGSGIGNVSIQESDLRDAIIDKLREAGIEVITDVEEAQRVLDEANGNDIRQQKTTIDAVIEARDNEYLEAVRNGDLDKAQRMVVEAAKLKGYNSGSQYQGTSAFNGAAPWGNGYFLTKEERKEAWDNDEYDGDQTLGDYIHRGIDVMNFNLIALDPRHYRAADPMHKEAIDNVRNAIQKKSKTITMYRSVPSDVKEGSFRNGDWVTPSRAYAVENAKVHGWGDNFNIIEQKVPVDEIWWDGNDIAEWGYGREEDFIKDTDFAYKNTKNNRKLLDAVTYDDNGNVIPLSKRFNESKSDIRFFRTADGNAYGFTVGGKIYIDQRIATADTPIHEYAHLWASAMQKLNPNEWANIVKLMKGTPIWEEVKRNYPELTTDNEIADEVLAFYSGSRGAERLSEEHTKILKGNGNVVEKVKAINAIKRVKEALKRFWKNVAEWFGIHFTTAEEVADKVLSDLLNGVNPTLAGVENDIRFEENSEEADIVARAKADGTYMKAPNGKKSNLSPRQWVQVRTKAFKDWFGDWENDPDNSSKVVDENGEPMVVYHGTTNDETEQKWNEKLKSYDTAHKQFTIFRRNTGGERNYGMFFNSDMDNAFAYGYYTYSVYLNIKNPLEIDCNNSSYDKIRYNGEVKDTYEWAKWAEKNGYDGVIFRNIRDGVDFNSMNEPTNDYVTFASNQIKSATDNVGTFDKNNPDIRYRRASNKSVISSRFERQAEIQREEKNTKSAANIVLGNANVVLNDTNIFDEQYQNAIDNNLIDENVSPLIDSFGITWGYQLKNGVIVINKDVFVSDILDKRVKDNLSLLISSLMKTNKTFFKEGISFFKKLPIWVLYKNDTKSNEDTIKEIINDILLGNTSIDTNKLELLKQYTVQDMNDILDNATKWFEKFEGISSNMFAGNSISDILDTTLGDLMPKEITTTQEGKRLNWFSKLGIDIRSKLFDSLDWFRVVSDKTKDKTASELYDAMIVHTKRVQGKIDIFDKEYVRPIIDTIQSMLGKDFGNSTLSLDLIQEYFAIKSLLGRTASLYKEKFELYLTNHESKKPPMFDEFKQIYDEITEDEIRQRINEMGEKSSMSILQKVDIYYLMEDVRRTLAAEMFVKQYVYSSANTLNQGLQGEQSLGLINEVTNEPYSELYQLLYSDEQSSQTMHSPIEIIEQADILIDRAGLRNEFDFIGNQIQAILNYVNIERVENGLMSYDTFAKRQLMKDFVNQRGENSSEGNLYEITAKQKANEKMKGKDWFNPNSITSIIAVAQTEIATMEKELLAQRLSYFLTNPNNFDVLSQYGMIIDEKETLNEELNEDERNSIMDKNIVLLYGERHTDKNTKGQVDKKKINILKRNDDGTFTKVTISFDNKFIGLEEFVKFVNNNFKYEELRGISKAVAPFTAWTSRIYTILSPLFPTKNLFKDLMVTPWLPAKELNGKNSQYAIKNFYNVFNNLSFILKMSFTEKSFSKKGFENKLKARSQELFEYYLEYSKQHSIFSIEDQIGALSKENKTLQDIERALSGKENKFIKFTERALLIKFMQHYAELFENLHKFSAYVTLRKLGYGEERSAQIANNATLNYDRSGSIGRQLNAIIPFAKAALGGLYRTNYLLPKYNPKGFLQRVITLAVLGVMQGLMYDPDDDDISEFARKSGMVFGSFLYPLLPEELSIVRPVRALVIVMAGKKSPAYFKQELMESTIDLVPVASDALRGAFSYNPLTNKTEFDVGQLFANTDKMTAFYALAMLASYINENKNSFGKNVLLNEETNTDKTRYGRTKQDYGLYDYLARLYNSILNGVDIDDRAAMSNKIGKNGERLMTIAKEDVEFVINNYIPFGRLYAYTAEIIYDAVNDKRINKGHIPLIGGLFAQKSFGKDYYLVNNIKYELKDFTNDFSQSQIEDIKTNILVKAKNMEGLRYKALKDNPNARPRMLDKAKQKMNDAFNVFILDINNFVNDNGDKKIDYTEDEYKFMLKSFLDSSIMKKALSIGEDTLNKHTAKRVERTYKRYKKYNNENIDTDKENMKDAVKKFKNLLYDKSITEEEFNDKLNSLYEPLFQQIKLRAKFAGYSIE